MVLSTGLEPAEPWTSTMWLYQFAYESLFGAPRGIRILNQLILNQPALPISVQGHLLWSRRSDLH